MGNSEEVLAVSKVFSNIGFSGRKHASGYCYYDVLFPTYQASRKGMIAGWAFEDNSDGV